MPETSLAALVEIAARAGAHALGRWRGDYRRWDKAPNHPVCDVDIEVDALLRTELRHLDPTAAWLSEEAADDPVRLAARRVWVVDPIDGTRDFLRGRDGWAISVALVEDGTLLLGVLDAPARGLRYAAARGAGATLNGLPIRASNRTSLAGARVPAEHLASADRDLAAVAKPNSIALRIAMVAEGSADLVAATRWGHEWDLAAAALIACEAGATVSDALGRPIAYNSPTAETFGVLAAAPGIHGAAVDRLRDRAQAAFAR